jgi:hypothetical protein
VDAFLIAIWIVRVAFLGLLYVFLLFVVRALLRDLRAASREPAAELGRLVVVGSPSGDPPVGASYPLDAVTGIGRDVNNAVVVDDPFASSDHAVLTFRGRAWYLEDAGSTNGTYLNGSRIDGLAPLGFGDEVQVGQVRFRLERGRA